MEGIKKIHFQSDSTLRIMHIYKNFIQMSLCFFCLQNMVHNILHVDWTYREGELDAFETSCDVLEFVTVLGVQL